MSSNTDATIVTQDVSDLLDYQADWSDYTSEFDVLIQSEWSIENISTEPDDTPLTISDVAFGARSSIVWLQGGKLNRAYRVTNKVVTTSGRVISRYFVLKVGRSILVQ